MASNIVVILVALVVSTIQEDGYASSYLCFVYLNSNPYLFNKQTASSLGEQPSIELIDQIYCSYVLMVIVILNSFFHGVCPIRSFPSFWVFLKICS